ncbi:MAG: hypothetical protein QG608_2398 [Actinomycetota bacterium]|nr:hypothetical protein [Actinomycetota bacterium]
MLSTSNSKLPGPAAANSSALAPMIHLGSVVALLAAGSPCVGMVRANENSSPGGTDESLISDWTSSRQTEIHCAESEHSERPVLALVTQSPRCHLGKRAGLLEPTEARDVQVPNEDFRLGVPSGLARIAGTRGGLVSEGEGGRTNITALFCAMVISRGFHDQMSFRTSLKSDVYISASTFFLGRYS